MTFSCCGQSVSLLQLQVALKAQPLPNHLLNTNNPAHETQIHLANPLPQEFLDRGLYPPGVGRDVDLFSAQREQVWLCL